MQSLLKKHFYQHANIIDNTMMAVSPVFPDVVNACIQTINHGGKILFVGNGGSAADAQHLAAEFVVRYLRDRRGLPALALTTDTSILTACGNDFSYEDIFARQVQAMGNPHDLLFAISTSGKSPNVIRAVESAMEKGMKTIAMAGKDGGPLAQLTNWAIIVPSDITARIQEMHILIGHAICDAVDEHYADFQGK